MDEQSEKTAGVPFEYKGPALVRDEQGAYVNPDRGESYAEQLTRLNLEVGRLFGDKEFTQRINDLVRATTELDDLARDHNIGISSALFDLENDLESAQQFIKMNGGSISEGQREEMKRRLLLVRRLQLAASRDQLSWEKKTGDRWAKHTQRLYGFDPSPYLHREAIAVPGPVEEDVERARKELAEAGLMGEYTQKLKLRGSRTVRDVEGDFSWVNRSYASTMFCTVGLLGEAKKAYAGKEKDLEQHVLQMYGLVGGSIERISVRPDERLFREASFHVNKYMNFSEGAGNRKEKLDVSCYLYSEEEGQVRRKIGIDFDKDEEIDVELTFAPSGEITEVRIPTSLVSDLKLTSRFEYSGSVQVDFAAAKNSEQRAVILQRLETFLQKRLGMSLKKIEAWSRQPVAEGVDAFARQKRSDDLPATKPGHEDYARYLVPAFAAD